MTVTEEVGRPWPSAVAAAIDELVQQRYSIRHWQRREHLFEQDQRGGHVVFLVQGLVKMIRYLDDRTPGTLEIGGRGEVLGALELVSGRPHQMRVVAAGDDGAAGFLLSRRWFEDLMTTNLFRQVLLGATAHRLETRVQRIAAARRSPPRQLAETLVRFAERYGVVQGTGVLLDLDLSQSDLALASGISEASAERALRRWRRNGVLTTGFRRLLIHDLDRLKSLET
jgi:CRP-like cAMP-binding protein